MAREIDEAAAAPAVAPARHYKDASEAIAAGAVALVTLTNSGYMDYTLNCIRSLELSAEIVPLTVFCADDASYRRLRATVPSVRTEHLHEEGLGGFCEWKERGWARLMWLKCEVVRRSLAAHDFVVFTDGDIVFDRRGAIEHCVNELIARGHDIVMQNDGLQDGNGVHGLCAGFMAIRSTQQTAATFDVDPATLTPGWDDQKFLNVVLLSGRLRYGVLPLALYPNGQYFQRHTEALHKARPGPYLVHFNWLVGDAKRASMSQHGRWLLGGGEADGICAERDETLTTHPAGSGCRHAVQPPKLASVIAERG